MFVTLYVGVFRVLIIPEKYIVVQPNFWLEGLKNLVIILGGKVIHLGKSILVIIIGKSPSFWVIFVIF